MDSMSHCSSFLLPSTSPSLQDNKTYALILLNQPLPKFTPKLWEKAKLCLCADGGANRVFDEMPLLLSKQDPDIVRKSYKPHVIKGDMDSIRAEVKDFYANLLCILVAGALGGRFDHEIGNINVLCNFSNIRIVLISDDCLIQLLPRTHRHEISIMSSVEGPHCGLIPITTASAKATTTGLQWDLDDTEMKFGGLISTSNIVREAKITVKSDSDLLWTISIRKPISSIFSKSAEIT